MNQSRRDTDYPLEPNDVEFLLRGLGLGRGFQLYIVQLQTLRDQKELLDALGDAPRITHAVLDEEDIHGRSLVISAVERFSAMLRDPALRPVVVIPSLDSIIGVMPGAIGELNERRNEMMQKLRGGLVVAASPELVERIRVQAPDIWSVRSGDLLMEPRALAPCPLELTSLWPRPRALRLVRSPANRRQSIHVDDAMPACGQGGLLDIALADAFTAEWGAPRWIGELYRQAAQQVADPALSAASTSCAALWFAVSGAQYEAGRMLSGLTNPDASYGASLRSLSCWGEVLLRISEGAHDAAVAAAERAVDHAKASDNEELRADALLVSSRALACAGCVWEATDAARDSERVARHVAYEEGQQLACVAQGELALSAGMRECARGAWEKSLSPASSPGDDGFSVLFSAVIGLEWSGQVDSAGMALHVIETLAEESNRYVEMLTSGVDAWWYAALRFGRALGVLESWLRDHSPYLAERQSGVLFERLRLVESRNALRCGSPEALDSNHLGADDASAGTIDCDSLAQALNCLLTAVALSGRVRDASAVALMSERCLSSDAPHAALAYLTSHVDAAGGCAQVPEPENAMIRLLVQFLEGQGRSAAADALLQGRPSHRDAA